MHPKQIFQPDFKKISLTLYTNRMFTLTDKCMPQDLQHAYHKDEASNLGLNTV